MTLASPRLGFAFSTSALTFALARSLFVYRSENSPEYKLPPDLVIVLMIPPVNPPYSAAAPSPPI